MKISTMPIYTFQLIQDITGAQMFIARRTGGVGIEDELRRRRTKLSHVEQLRVRHACL